MILFYSGGGGSRNYTPESVLEGGDVMLTFFLNTNTKTIVDEETGRKRTRTKPDNRMQAIFDHKQKDNDQS